MLKKNHWHPLLLALYPSLHLLAQNTDSVRPTAALTSLVVSAAFTLVFWGLCSAVLKDRSKSTLLTSLAVALFFSFGHIHSLVGSSTAVAWILIAGSCVLCVFAGIRLARWQGTTRPLNRTLDIITLVLTVMVMVPITRSELSPATNLPSKSQPIKVKSPLGYLPDIYVIVLDAFGRADKLQEIYDVDLSPLQSHLTENNFEIAEWANANYCQTSLSLACMLNSGYIENLLPPEQRSFRGRKNLNRIVQTNRHVSRLRRIGYQLVTLSGASELAVQLNPDVNYKGGALNEFQATLLSTTPLPIFSTLISSKSTSSLDPYAKHRENLQFQLEKLPHVMADKGPKLVFAHILAPHPPFVLGPGGEEITPNYTFNVGERYAWDGYVKGYAAQTKWLAEELQKTVDGILAAAHRPPVILIVGDHGPASMWIDLYHRTNSFETTDSALIAERMAIFLALHMPDGEGGDIYPEMTLINVFPLIFERIFGEKAKLIPDHSFFSTYDRWSLLTNVDYITNRRP